MNPQVGVCKDKNSQSAVVLECDSELCKSELNTSQDIGISVLFVLSSDESQHSENSENEEKTLAKRSHQVEIWKL